MNELTKSESALTEASGFNAMIERMALNPDVDVDKLERLLAMQERVIDRQAKIEFTAAKIAMQAALPSITMKGAIVIRDKNTNKITQSTPYARFEDIHEAVMPILNEYGFDLDFKNRTTETGKPVVTTILSHISGHSKETEFELPIDSSGSKNNVQGVGSSNSYGKRYGITNILNLRVHGEDDDGVEAGKPEPISEEQFATISDLLKSTQTKPAAFISFLATKGVEIETVKDLPAKSYEAAVNALKAKGKKQ